MLLVVDSLLEVSVVNVICGEPRLEAMKATVPVW